MERNSSDYKARAEKAETAAAELRQECERLRQCCDDMKQAMAVPSQDLVNAMQKCVSERDALREQLATVTRERDTVAKYRDDYHKRWDSLKALYARAVDSFMNAASVAEQRAEKAETEAAELREQLALWRPLTDEEAQKALDEAEAAPMSEERIAEIVRFATDPANQLDNSQQAQLAAANKSLREQLAYHKKEEQLLVDLWRSDAFAAEGRDGDARNLSPAGNAVDVLQRQRRRLDELREQLARVHTNYIKHVQEMERLRSAERFHKKTITELREQLATVTKDRRCQGCGLFEMHTSCPAQGTDAYMRSTHPAWGSVWGILNLKIAAAVERAEKAEAERDEARERESAASSHAHGMEQMYENAERAASESAKRLEECREVLREVQYRHYGSDKSGKRQCASCGRYEGDNCKERCRLAACLQSTQPKEETIRVSMKHLTDAEIERRAKGGESASEKEAAEPPGTCQGQQAAKATPAPLPEYTRRRIFKALHMPVMEDAQNEITEIVAAARREALEEAARIVIERSYLCAEAMAAAIREAKGEQQ